MGAIPYAVLPLTAIVEDLDPKEAIHIFHITVLQQGPVGMVEHDQVVILGLPDECHCPLMGTDCELVPMFIQAFLSLLQHVEMHAFVMNVAGKLKAGNKDQTFMFILCIGVVVCKREEVVASLMISIKELLRGELPIRDGGMSVQVPFQPDTLLF